LPTIANSAKNELLLEEKKDIVCLKDLSSIGTLLKNIEIEVWN